MSKENVLQKSIWNDVSKHNMAVTDAIPICLDEPLGYLLNLYNYMDTHSKLDHLGLYAIDVKESFIKYNI